MLYFCALTLTTYFVSDIFLFPFFSLLSKFITLLCFPPFFLCSSWKYVLHAKILHECPINCLFQVYHSYFMPLEWTVPHRPENTCYAKLVCNKKESVSTNEYLVFIGLELHIYFIKTSIRISFKKNQFQIYIILFYPYQTCNSCRLNLYIHLLLFFWSLYSFSIYVPVLIFWSKILLLK